MQKWVPILPGYILTQTQDNNTHKTHKQKRFGAREETMQQELIELILQLNTNSEKDRYNALLECMNLYPSLFSDEDKSVLIASFKSKRDAKVAQGKKDAEKRWNKNHKVNDAKWLFLGHSPYKGKCTKCNQDYYVDDPVFVEKPGNRGYHHDCAPESAKQDPNAKSFYDKWLLNGENNG